MSIVIGVILAALAAFGYFLFRGKGTKAAIVVNAQQTASYKQLLVQHVDYYIKLNDADRLLFEQRIALFLNDTNIEGIGT